MMQSLDLTRHPFDANSVLNWMIREWKKSPQEPLVILTAKDDGDALDNRLRVKLSTARTAIKQRMAYSEMIQFGFTSVVVPWTLEDNTELEALCLTRVVFQRHVYATAFADFDWKNHG